MSKSRVALLKKGDVLSEAQYYTVDGVDGDIVHLTNERGLKLSVAGEVVEDGMFSAEQSIEEVKKTREEIVDMMRTAGDTVFTVCFFKQKDAAELKEIINDPKITVKTQAAAKDILNGDLRVLKGRLVLGREQFGRFSVIDLTIPYAPSSVGYDNRYRQVDQKTIQWLILKNTKYTVKP